MKQPTKTDLPKPGAKSARKKSVDADRSAFRMQVLRLGSTQYFPAIDEGVKELVDSLIRVTYGDIEWAERIIDRSTRTSKTCPTVADFETLAPDVELPDQEAPKGCAECEGTGLRYASKPVHEISIDPITTKRIVGPVLYYTDCQELCSCVLGQFRKSREAERKKGGS